MYVGQTGSTRHWENMRTAGAVPMTICVGRGLKVSAKLSYQCISEH